MWNIKRQCIHVPQHNLIANCGYVFSICLVHVNMFLIFLKLGCFFLFPCTVNSCPKCPAVVKQMITIPNALSHCLILLTLKCIIVDSG